MKKSRGILFAFIGLFAFTTCLMFSCSPAPQKTQDETAAILGDSSTNQIEQTATYETAFDSLKDVPAMDGKSHSAIVKFDEVKSIAFHHLKDHPKIEPISREINGSPHLNDNRISYAPNQTIRLHDSDSWHNKPIRLCDDLASYGPAKRCFPNRV